MHLSEPRQALGRDLLKILRSDQISLTAPDRFSYGRDCNSKSILWAKQHQIKFPPDAIVWPESAEELAIIAKFAHQQRLPIIPFGGGSGVCGGTWALRGGIAVDLKRMDQVLELDSRALRLVAQAGINGEVLERKLQRKGLTLGHFPSSIYIATLGGYLACRSAGQLSTLYGKIEDMVEGIEVVLPQGERVRLGLVRDRPGEMDLKELFLGSEGTLGFVTEASLRIHRQPEARDYFGFSFGSLQTGLDAIREMLQRGLKPAVVRLYDELDSLIFGSHGKDKASLGAKLKSAIQPMLHWAKDRSLKLALQRSSWLKRAVDWLPADCILIVGFEGPAELNEVQSDVAREIFREKGGKDLGPGLGEYWLKHRYSVSYKLSPLFDEGFFADTMEVATTWSRLPELYRAVREAVGQHALVLAHFSHAYEDGCSIYFTFVGYRESIAAEEALYDLIWKDGLEACLKAGGTISHHHGVGLLKAEYMRRQWGDSFAWLEKVKKELDPHGIMNPGKLGFGIA